MDSKTLKHLDVFITLHANDLLATQGDGRFGNMAQVKPGVTTAQRKSPPLPRQTNRQTSIYTGSAAALGEFVCC